MFNGYPVCPALTSLVFLVSLAVMQPVPKKPHACSDIHRLYSPRLLRELRARLMLAYAQAHERRAAAIAKAIRNHTSVPEAIEAGVARSPQSRTVDTQESDDPKLKHLLAYVAMNCF